MRRPSQSVPGPAGVPDLRLHDWRHPTVLAVALLAIMAGFGQYSVTASLADVAATFGAVTEGNSIAARAGLSATSLGLGLGIIRMASLAALPASSAADHLGRRRVLLIVTSGGLVLTVAAAFTPSYWWFVAVVALGRPLFSAGNAIGGVVAGEQTTSAHRAKAIALAIAGYAIGVGLASVVRVPLAETARLGFRGLFAASAVFLVALPFVARMLGEPDRYVALTERRTETRRWRSLAAVPVSLRRRLVLLAGLSFALNLVTGPGNTFLFLYAESILGISPGRMAVSVVIAGPLGLLGLLAGRWAADRLGRRATAIGAQMVVAAGGLLAYAGAPIGLFAGYWALVAAQAAYGPAMGALSTEVFPTSFRATAAGWLLAATVVGAVVGLFVFGVVSDLTNGFGWAALAVGMPCAAAALAFLALPETRGHELEDSAPEPE